MRTDALHRETGCEHTRDRPQRPGTSLPGAGGTLNLPVYGFVTGHYAAVQVISTGGTALVSASLLGKKRTLTL
jgi:hypothetical protein